MVTSRDPQFKEGQVRFTTVLFKSLYDTFHRKPQLGRDCYMDAFIPKVLIQGKLIAVAYTLRTLCSQFSQGGLCKQEWMHQCLFSIRGG